MNLLLFPYVFNIIIIIIILVPISLMTLSGGEHRGQAKRRRISGSQGWPRRSADHSESGAGGHATAQPRCREKESEAWRKVLNLRRRPHLDLAIVRPVFGRYLTDFIVHVLALVQHISAADRWRPENKKNPVRPKGFTGDQKNSGHNLIYLTLSANYLQIASLRFQHEVDIILCG